LRRVAAFARLRRAKGDRCSDADVDGSFNHLENQPFFDAKETGYGIFRRAPRRFAGDATALIRRGEQTLL
jgi:hypothetical protein